MFSTGKAARAAPGGIGLRAWFRLPAPDAPLRAVLGVACGGAALLAGWGAAAEATPPTARDLVETVRLGGGLMLSPDGSRLAWSTRRASVEDDTSRITWWAAPADGSQPAVRIGGDEDDVRIARSGGWSPEVARWSPDGRMFAFLRKTEAGTQVWLNRFDGGPLQALTRNAADVTSFEWSADGRAVLFQTDAPRAELAAAEQAEGARGYLVDDDTFNAFYEPRPVRPPYRLTGGKPVRWSVDVVGGAERRLADDETPPAFRQRFQADAAEAPVWLVAADPEKQGLSAPRTVFARDGEEARKCEDPACTGVSQVVGLSDQKEAIFIRTDLGQRSLLAWSPSTGAVRTILSTPMQLGGCLNMERYALCSMAGPSTTARLAAIDYRSGEVTTRFDPNPGLALAFGEPERLVWKNAYGVDTWGWLIKPLGYRSDRAYPLVIVQYNADHCLNGGTGDEFPTHLFAASGMAVLCLSYPFANREKFETEKDPYVLLRADYEGYIRQKHIQSSIETIIAQLADRGLVDPARVGLTGLSAGVETLQYMLVNSRAIAAAATAGGGIEPMSRYGSTAKSRREIEEPLGWGDPFDPEQSWGFPAISLSWAVEKIDVPLLIHAADREFLFSLQPVVTWKIAGKPVEMFVFPDEHHVKTGPAHMAVIYERNRDWFNFWLRGVEDPDPSKAEQYERWRALRAARPGAAAN